ncbi:MAG: hypothetical protein JSV63_00405 [Candidatus Aenigmatarchaeota archaeon]|nr:MAG: hypothetical protein JSV63_00405 [Candidatus Aenigmarchaeota archaeon]
MDRKTLLAVPLLMIVAITTSGCIAEDTAPPPTGGQCLAPKKMIGEICCYDQNSNDICDMEEAGCPDSCDDDNACTDDSCSADTDFKCLHEVISPCCGNGVCEKNEEWENVCDDDCEVLDITDFQFAGTPDYIDEDTFVFIHTGSAESQEREFFLNITAGISGMRNIRYTFECNSTQHEELDSIDSEVTNASDEIEEAINKLDTSNYLIYSNFFTKKTATFSRDIDILGGKEKAAYHFRITKKSPQKRDDLTCLTKFYFMEPRKIVHKWLEISYI